MKPVPVDENHTGWSRGWWYPPKGATLVECNKCQEGLVDKVTFSPGEGLGTLCPSCALKSDKLSEDEENEYLQWLEDQAEIADAEEARLGVKHTRTGRWCSGKSAGWGKKWTEDPKEAERYLGMMRDMHPKETYEIAEYREST